MFNRILVAIDGLKQTESVLGRAAVLAARQNADVVLLMVLPAPKVVVENGRMIATIDQEVERLRAEVEPYLTEWKNRFQASGIRASVAVTFGDPGKEIADYARENNINLIVMPTQPQTGLARLIKTSVTDKVIRAASTPVLVMKAA